MSNQRTGIAHLTFNLREYKMINRKVLLTALICIFAVSPKADADCEPNWVSSFSGTDGLDGGAVSALAVFDGYLVAGGTFDEAGGEPAAGIAKWDGESWSELGGGITDGFAVLAMAVHDDGSGPALYVAGRFEELGGQPVSRHIAKWDGDSWSSLGGGVTAGNFVWALTEFDDKLIVGGEFWEVDDEAVGRIAQWDGQEWSTLEDGVSGGPSPSIFAVEAFDDGSGEALYVGGRFWHAGEVEWVRDIAKWDGEQWSKLDEGMNGPVHSLSLFDDGSGMAIYAGGGFTSDAFQQDPMNRIARWGGESWSAVGLGGTDDGMQFSGSEDPSVNVLTIFDDGSGEALYAAGVFDEVDGDPANGIAQWDGDSWVNLGEGVDLGGDDQSVNALAAFDGGPGPADSLYVGGFFEAAGGASASNLARWQACESPVIYHDRFEQ